MNNFFGELKRRNVYKVAIAYAVVAWLLIQIASVLFPTFEAPPWVMKVFVAVIALGFPIALVFSWAFEITPEGIKREEEVLPNDIDHAPHRAENCWDYHRRGGYCDRPIYLSTAPSTPNEYRCPVGSRQGVAGEVRRRARLRQLER